MVVATRLHCDALRVVGRVAATQAQEGFAFFVQESKGRGLSLRLPAFQVDAGKAAQTHAEQLSHWRGIHHGEGKFPVIDADLPIVSGLPQALLELAPAYAGEQSHGQ